MLEVNEISVHYGKALVLENISMHLGRGEIVSVIGANGAGKSTLAMAISGLKVLSSGKIMFLGERIDGLPAHRVVKRGISQCPERWRIGPEMSVLENLMLGAYLVQIKEQRRERLERVFDLFPILKERVNQQGGTLSGGERQMLSIGRALMADPKLLILDEPSLGIAPILKEKIFESIESLRENLTILLIDQDAYMALGIADRAYIIESGKMICEGLAEDLLQNDLIRRAYLGI